MQAPASFNEQYYIQPDGLRMRYGWFRTEGKARGTILCLGGRREFIEKDFELIGQFLARGLDVVALDWRGQGGSGRMLPNPHKGHVDSFDDYRNDLQRFYQAVIKPEAAGPLLVFGHSMGAFIATDWLLQNKPDVRAGIFATPMLALPISSSLYGIAHALTHAGMFFGMRHSYIPGEHDFDPRAWVFAHNILTHDPQRFRIIPDWFVRRPELALGGITYAWLDAAIVAIRRVRAVLPALDTPVLVLNAGRDSVTLSAEVSRCAKRMPRATEKIYHGALHDLMCETDDILAKVWKDIDEFLKALLHP